MARRGKLLALAALLAVGGAVPLAANEPTTPLDAATAAPALDQLRHVIGDWAATTNFIGSDRKIAASFEGSYQFKWVIEDKLISGTSEIPKLAQTSSILFYLRPATNEIEMASVGGDGQLWVMTGPDDSETRTTGDQTMPDGTTLRLRFTRFNVTADRFESRMELSTDRGATWRPGNHQQFRRCGSEGAVC